LEQRLQTNVETAQNLQYINIGDTFKSDVTPQFKNTQQDKCIDDNLVPNASLESKR
jgi:hypothetical protein